MRRNITNCIQKTWTESENTVILVQISEPISDTFFIKIFFRFLYIRTELIHTQKDSTQNSHINL